MAIKRVLLTSIQELMKHKNPSISNQTKYYLTNKHAKSLTQHQKQIKELSSLKNIQWIPNYKSALQHLQKNQLSLIIGDPHQSLHHELINQKYKFITLEEIGSIFPVKVPLSFRSHETQIIKKTVEERLNMNLEKQPQIHHILLTNHEIKLWDEAFQVLLDLNEQKKQFIVQYDFEEKSDELYRLKMQDFLNALRVCYRTIHKEEQLKIIDYNKENRQIQWFKKYVIPKEEQEKLEICLSLL